MSPIAARPSVYLYAGRSIHPFYRHQFACSPPGFDVAPSSDALAVDEMKSDVAGWGTLRHRATTTLKAAAIRSFECARLPNLGLVRLPAADLVHSAQHLIVQRRPWVVDFEDVSVFFWHRRSLLDSRIARAAVRRLLGSPYCRRLLPWTRAAYESLVNTFDDPTIAPKTCVVPPAISAPPGRSRRSRRGVVRLLFVGTHFYVKGGLETVRAFKALRNHFPVELTMVTFLPEEARQEVSRVDGLRVLTRLPAERLEAEYAEADLFVLPVHTDTFGFVFLEALARGIPCVSTDHFAVPEIVDQGRTGVLVAAENSYFGRDRRPLYDPVGAGPHPLVDRLKEPSADYVRSLERALATLVGDLELREHMGGEAVTETTDGRFSCSRRREEMARVYQQALDGA